MRMILMYNQHKERDIMFKVKKGEDTVNKTFRLPEALVNKMAKIAQSEGVSLNNFVTQCCKYALEHLQQSNDDAEID